MTKPETLGQRLAQLRREKACAERRDIEQKEIARAAGIGAKRQSYVSRWENDKVKPNDAALVKLAEYYGVNVGWLRFGEGPQQSPALPAGVGPRRPRRPTVSTEDERKRGAG